MSQAPSGEQQPMSNLKRSREGETYEPYKRAQGLEYPDMGANFEDNAYPQRDTTQEMLPNLPKWRTGSQGPLRMEDSPTGTVMPMNNQQQIHRPRPQVQPIPQPSMQVQPIHTARPQTASQAQFIQSTFPTPIITPRRKPKKGKTAPEGAPNAAPVAPGNSVYEFGLQHVGSNEIGQPPFRSQYIHQQVQATGAQDHRLQQKTPLHQQLRGPELHAQGPVYGQPLQRASPSSRYIHQDTQAPGAHISPLQRQTLLHQQVQQQEQIHQQPPIGLYAPPKVPSSKPPGASAGSRQQQMPGTARSQEGISKAVTDVPRGPASPAPFEPFPQSIQSKWLANAWKSLTLPKLDVLPGINVQTRLSIGPEDKLIIPAFVLQMRGLDAQCRLEAWIKITKLGRSFYTLFPKNPQWKDAWEDILQFSAKMLKQEREYYKFVEKIDPVEKVRLFKERTMHVRVEPALVDPWNPQWTDPELSEFARQNPRVGAPADPVYVVGSPTNQAGNHPRVPYAQNGSRAISPMSVQSASVRPSSSTPLQSPMMQEQSSSQYQEIATPPQAPDHAWAVPLADQTQRWTKAAPTALPSPAPPRKRKSRASKKESASNKKLQTDKGQGDKMQQEIPPWLKELEKTYLANQAEIDAYYMEHNDLGMRDMNDHFSDKMRTWNGRPAAWNSSAFAQQQKSNVVRQDASPQGPFSEVQPTWPGQYTAEEEMIAEGAAQAYIADLKRGTVLPPLQAHMLSDAMPPREQYAAPQAQMFAPNPPVQPGPDPVTARNLAAPGQAGSLHTAPVMQAAGLQQPIETPTRQVQQQSTQQDPTPPNFASPEVCEAPPPPRLASPPANTVPQAAQSEQKKPASIFDPTQEAQKTVYRQMLARNAALDKRLELPESERIVVGGIDIAALLDAGTDMMKIIEQITPFMQDPDLVVDQTERPEDTEEQLGTQFDDGLAQDNPLPAVPPTFIHAPEHGWNNVEVIDEFDVPFWPGMDNICDAYLAEQGRKAFAGETKAEREEWEAHVAAEYKREMEKLDEMFGKDTYYIGDW